MQESSVPILDLFDCECVIVRCHGHITTVDDLETGLEWVHRQWDVIATIQIQSTRTCANARWSESCTGAIRCRCVLDVRLGQLSEGVDCKKTAYERGA
jgi:hypothetical protein